MIGGNINSRNWKGVEFYSSWNLMLLAMGVSHIINYYYLHFSSFSHCVIIARFIFRNEIYNSEYLRDFLVLILLELYRGKKVFNYFDPIRRPEFLAYIAFLQPFSKWNRIVFEPILLLITSIFHIPTNSVVAT